MAQIHFIHVGDTPRAPLTINIPERNEYRVGQSIEYTGDMANEPGHGAIVSIEPADRWGGPYARIILTDGRDMLRQEIRFIRPLSERQGCMHRLLAGDEIATASQIAALIGAAAMRKADVAAKEAEAKQIFTNQCSYLKVNHPGLIQGDDHKVAAKNIRKLLKAAFPKTKFSVVVPHYGSIDIRWTDGPTDELVSAITKQFQEGYFDGMGDCYKHTTSPWNKTFGGAKYVHTQREYSDQLVAAGIELVVEFYGETNKPTVEDYRAGRAWNVSPVFDSGGNHYHDWQSLINRKCSEISA